LIVAPEEQLAGAIADVQVALDELLNLQLLLERGGPK